VDLGAYSLFTDGAIAAPGVPFGVAAHHYKLLCRFDTSTTDFFGTTPSTATGGIIFPTHITPQVGAGAVQLAEATTNLVVNPIFENNVTDGWSTGANATATHYTSDAYMGSASCKVATTGTGNRYIRTSAFARGADDDVTIQVRVKAISASVQIELRLYGSDFANRATTSAQTITPDDGWVYITLTVDDATMDGWSSPTNLFLLVHNDLDGGTDKEFLVDAAQAELKSYPTPICHGSLGDGHSWSGAAHNSTSSRTQAYIEYDPADIPLSAMLTEGTIAFWAMFPLDVDGGSEALALTDWRNWLQIEFSTTTGNNNGIRLQPNSNGLVTAWISDKDGYAASYAITWPAYTWKHVIYTWDKSQTKAVIYVNGSVVAQNTGFGEFSLDGNEFVRLGNTAAGNSGVWFDDFVVLDRALTDEEVYALYKSGVPMYAG